MTAWLLIGGTAIRTPASSSQPLKISTKANKSSTVTVVETTVFCWFGMASLTKTTNTTVSRLDCGQIRLKLKLDSLSSQGISLISIGWTRYLWEILEFRLLILVASLDLKKQRLIIDFWHIWGLELYVVKKNMRLWGINMVSYRKLWVWGWSWRFCNFIKGFWEIWSNNTDWRIREISNKCFLGGQFFHRFWSIAILRSFTDIVQECSKCWKSSKS